MILSWMGCATIAIFMARYMRPAWPDTKLFDKKLWFVVRVVFVSFETTIIEGLKYLAKYC